jgi:SAM domain (Sterile alpha motif)
MDVADWLRGLGLEQYEAAFRENDVNAELLPRLTADDLKDLGVISVGHRRRLLEAIDALRLKGTQIDDPAQLSPVPSTNPIGRLVRPYVAPATKLDRPPEIDRVHDMFLSWSRRFYGAALPLVGSGSFAQPGQGHANV